MISDSNDGYVRVYYVKCKKRKTKMNKRIERGFQCMLTVLKKWKCEDIFRFNFRGNFLEPSQKR